MSLSTTTNRFSFSRYCVWDSSKATQQTGHHWHAVDFTNAFAERLCSPPFSDYAESYFQSPSRLGKAPLASFKTAVAAQLTHTLQTVESSGDTVVAVCGVASLFGFLRISEVLPLCESAVQGRLTVVFPGIYEENNYRLLDARDGWNYHAVPITASEGAELSRISSCLDREVQVVVKVAK